MKKVILTVMAAVTLALSVSAQVEETNAAPVAPTWGSAFDSLKHGSNYFVATFGSASVNQQNFGGGVAVGYKALDWLAPIARLDYFSGSFYLVSGTLQLKPPQTWMGKFPVTPFADAGVGVGIGGLGTLNGQPIGIVGAGAYLDLNWVGNGWVWKHVKPFGCYERWAGNVPSDKANRIQFGVVVPLGL